MAKLIPLSQIPTNHARRIEARARRFASRSEALEKARYEIQHADGTHAKPYAPILGWVLTRAAAQALLDERIAVPWPCRLWSCPLLDRERADKESE